MEPIRKQELSQRLCEDRHIHTGERHHPPLSAHDKCVLRRKVEILDEIRWIGQQNLNGWELDGDTD